MTTASTRYVLSVLGQDRPGIVAAVSRVLTDAGCNIEDSSMTILRGAFAMLLIISVPEGRERDLRAGLVGMTTVEGFLVHVDPYPEGQERQTVGELYTLSLHGADHSGIVAAVTGLLAQRGVNIVDLSTRVLQGQVPVYAMIMEVVLPANVSEADLSAELQRLSLEIDCAITLSPVETLAL